MATCLLGLGSNLGDRQGNLDEALGIIEGHSGVQAVRRSHNYETPAIGGPPDQGPFLNAAARLETDLTPDAVHQLLLEIERRLGRQRRQHWAARTLDLDLLLYDDLVRDDPQLTVPHPRMAFRRFVIEPAAEVAGEIVHPRIGWTINELRDHLSSSPEYLAITGPPGAGKSDVAAQVVSRLQDAKVSASWVRDEAPELLFNEGFRDSTGHVWRTQIEFLRCRRDALDAARRAESDGWMISDFWFDQSLAYANLFLSSPEGTQFRQAFESGRHEVIQPKLLVVLGATARRLPSREPQRGQEGLSLSAGEIMSRLPKALQKLITEGEPRPVLRLFQDDLEKTIDEVTAAVLAMHVVPRRVELD